MNQSALRAVAAVYVTIQKLDEFRHDMRAFERHLEFAVNEHRRARVFAGAGQAENKRAARKKSTLVGACRQGYRNTEDALPMPREWASLAAQ